MQVLSLKGIHLEVLLGLTEKPQDELYKPQHGCLPNRQTEPRSYYSQLHSAGLLHNPKLMIGTMPSKEIPSVKGWAGVSLAANLGIQSGPHLSAEGDSDDQPAEGNSSQTSSGCGIVTQSIPGLRLRQKAGQLLLLLLLLLLSSCFLPAALIGH